jgi:hypothetical protein
MTQPDAGSESRRWRGAITAVGPPAALLAAVAALGMAQVVRDRSESPSCVVPSAVPIGEVGPAARAPGGGGLRIVEKGFTQMNPGSGLFALTGLVSLGAVLENASDQAAYRTRITFRVFDEQNRSVTPDSEYKSRHVEIPVLHPHQRVVVGNGLLVKAIKPGVASRIAGFDIELGTTHWVSSDVAKQSFARVSVESQTSKRFAEGSGGVIFTLRSGYCRITPNRGVAMVFRDAAGVIVGGAFDTSAAGGYCRPGDTENELATAFYSMPEDADLTKTEVSAYCDVSRPDPAPSESDVPIN